MIFHQLSVLHCEIVIHVTRLVVDQVQRMGWMQPNHEEGLLQNGVGVLLKYGMGVSNCTLGGLYLDLVSLEAVSAGFGERPKYVRVYSWTNISYHKMWWRRYHLF